MVQDNLPPLVYDRTEADVEQLQALLRRGWDNLTADEQADWLTAGHKGAYNYTDLNRVGTAANYVAARLSEWGYPCRMQMRTDWREDELFYAEDLADYLAAAEKLRGMLAVFDYTPPTPDKLNNVAEANAIEKIIADVWQLLQNMIAALPWCDTIYSGDYPEQE